MQRHSARLSFLTLGTCVASLAMTGCVVYLDGSLDVGDEVETSDDLATTDDADTEATSLDGEVTTDDPDGESTTEDTVGEGGCAQAIDIVFVIDNSGSMGEEQTQVVEAIGSMVAALDLAGMDWRIGVTTTDNGNPWCPAGTTTPEAGTLVASSCRTRLGDFLFSDTVDVQDSACNDVCAHQEIELASTVIDGVARPGTWVERSGGVANTFVREGQDLIPIDPVEALRCILPQGVNGCGFESQLESMQLALARTADVNQDQFGFLRPEAQLAVVIISDETDCSYDKDWADIFAQDGNKAFWSDPSAAFPTSAVCWNAGMECTGKDGNVYTDCVARDKDQDGNLLAPGDDELAVLHPIASYTDALAGLEAAKQQLDPGAQVRVFGIVGVQLDGSLHFADVGDSDPAFQDSFGIGPGCTADANVAATPPGRMREVISQFDGSLHSVCKPQYIDAFQTIANRVTADCGQ